MLGRDPAYDFKNEPLALTSRKAKHQYSQSAAGCNATWSR